MEIGADGLVNDLEKVFIIFVDTGQSGIIGFEKAADAFHCANLKQEFFEEEKPCIGGEVAAVKINFNLAIAFQAYRV